MSGKGWLRSVVQARIAAPAGRWLRSELQARQQPGRQLGVHADDTFIVSYPKSGNTWVRFLVGSLVHPEPPTDFGNIDVRVPTIYKATARELGSLPRPRVLKSHEYFDPRYPRVIYVVRDPRDVLVSYYHYSVRKGFIAGTASIAAFGDDFMTGRLDGFGTWHDNVASWLAARTDSASFVLVRYEDLIVDGARELARIAALLGLERTRDEIARVVDECSFEKMRELERTTGARSEHMKHRRADVAFVRQGRSGGWRDELPDQVTKALEVAWAPLMTRLGYLGTDARRNVVD